LDGLLNPQWTEGAKAAPRRGGKAQDRGTSAHWQGTRFREQLRREFGLMEVQRGKTYFLHPEDWWAIYKTIFKYDPNSLVHGVMFAREQLRMSRLLTVHLEAFGAARVGRSGVKFDRLGKTVSGQPIFDVDEETAHEIRATFILDLALLRSYGRGPHGLAEAQKRLLLELSLWKIQWLLGQPFRYRTGCHLMCSRIELSTEEGVIGESLPSPDLQPCIRDCRFGPDPVTKVYYPANDLFKVRQDEDATIPERADDEDGGIGAED
jgi:CRISPR-associated protein Csb1